MVDPMEVSKESAGVDRSVMWRGSARCSTFVEMGFWTCFRCAEGENFFECGAPGVMVYTASGRASLLTPSVLGSSCLFLRELE